MNPKNTIPINWYQENYNTLRADLPSGGVVGLFYDSYSHQRHISHYTPYAKPPRESLCKKAINFSPTGSQDNICPVCLQLLTSEIKALLDPGIPEEARTEDLRDHLKK